ncbi:MAG: protein-L-isoaspartate(D-aspartate) O-methyltransferase, partial [Flavobacteriales bacterium]|nr:protein-L-isoaspartate(D-aspartate) O-methyltransferase [Flavobacteriales bacterium]
PQVLEAIGKVQRHVFIEDTAFLEKAYEDIAFPIGCGQTISQPYTVAFQTELLSLERGMRVLEIGTGSGYQTAVLAALGAKVWSIERHRQLHLATKRRLERLGVRANLYYGDGYLGLPSHAPFDRVLVTCGAPLVPDPLFEQLRIGGTLVVPVDQGSGQVMWRVGKQEDGSMVRTEHGRFRFVPMLEHRSDGGRL